MYIIYIYTYIYILYYIYYIYIYEETILGKTGHHFGDGWMLHDIVALKNITCKRVELYNPTTAIKGWAKCMSKPGSSCSVWSLAMIFRDTKQHLTPKPLESLLQGKIHKKNSGLLEMDCKCWRSTGQKTTWNPLNSRKTCCDFSFFFL